MRKRMIAFLSMTVLCGFPAYADSGSKETLEASDRAYIEETLNLANNDSQEWTYSAQEDAWVLSPVSAVAYPEIEEEQGVSVCVPGAYVAGIDTDGDQTADVTAGQAEGPVNGSLVLDYEAQVTSSNGQVYTAKTAPVILNTGAAGYGSSTNTSASAVYASEGYINVSCGNRGKQDTALDEEGNTYYTGDAPSCLADQKAAARYVKYNILLGNLPGSPDYLVSTGGSGGGAHAVMFAVTSNNPDFYDYQIEAGAVGVYADGEGGYSTSVTIDGADYEISDGAWGCIAYSAITSLAEADMAMAFEYTLDASYEFGTPFQEQLAGYLSEAYMEYINDQELSVNESDVGFDLNEDGDMEDTIALTISCDPEAYPETNGYYGTYLDLYLAEFQANLQWYLDNLDYAQDWTWFDENGSPLSDEEVADMTGAEKAEAFLEGRYAKSSSGGGEGMGGGHGAGRGGFPVGEQPEGEMPEGGFPGGEQPEGEMPEGGFPGGEQPDGEMPEGGFPGGELPEDGLAEGDLTAGDMPNEELPEGDLPGGQETGAGRGFKNQEIAENGAGDQMDVGTPQAGTTQAAGSSLDSRNYATYEEMLEAYAADIDSIEAGDRFGNQIVELYNPLNYIGDEETEDPSWVRILMGAAEGDMSMFSSLNLQIAMLNAGIGAEIEWQWDGGHVPSEIFSESFSRYVDQMYSEYVNQAAVELPQAEAQTENGTAQEPSGTDLRGWVDASDITDVSFTLADAAAYRTAGASKAIPGFDVIDYGQEDYVFGNREQDARHWNRYLLEIFEEYREVLEPLFNSN